MSIRTVSSREFNQDVAKAKRLAANGPVFVTDRGKPAHVLLNIQDYEKIQNQNLSIVDLLAMPDASDIEFEPHKINEPMFKKRDPF